MKNCNHEETQMTTSISMGASSATTTDVWSSLPWPAMNRLVLRLQLRIAKAEREGRRGKVKALQRLLTTSFSAKCVAVKRVTSTPGKTTPGVDGQIWRTPHQKRRGVADLKRKGYQPNPLRRIYIPKKSNPKERRPLSIPTFKDRAMQALHLLSLEPIVEERADPNAYGFRLKRSCQDAREQCFSALSRANSATWILEGDIKACFDRINHDYLLREIPMDKVILKKFLTSGYMDKHQLYPTLTGTPQGGPISPALALFALSGLEGRVRSNRDRQRSYEKINMIAYADDFIVTASSKELLMDKVIPTLMEALKPVGLELSPTKTKITHIRDGFDFLGFNIRKYSEGKLLIKPAKANITAFLKELRTTVKQYRALPTPDLIHTLNARLTGWVNYYRTSVSSKVFSRIDHELFQALLRWGMRRHARKGKRWIVKKYFTSVVEKHWRFYCTVQDKQGQSTRLYLKSAAATKIQRHIKLRSEATPFNPLYKAYFKQREAILKQRKGTDNETGSILLG